MNIKINSEEDLTWQAFEGMVGRIFESHGFDVRYRWVFKNKRRKYEIDVFAERYGRSISVDCKRYGKGRYRVSQLKSEAKKHKQRCDELQKVFKFKVKAIPMIVAWIDDPLLFEGGCLFVSYEKLEDFLNNMEYYLELFKIRGKTVGMKPEEKAR